MINCIINGKNRSIDISPVATLRDMLLLNGNFAVRDSDDAEGFCGSDTVLLDGTPVFSNLVLAGEAEGCEIRTPDSLGNSQHLTVVQQALIDAGVVQSAYNAPAAALLMTWLFENNPEPTREDVKDALSGIFIRDAGYEHYYLAAELIKEKPAYGNIICRCESISEGEILDAIHRPLGARSLDGVKRRTRAGMGRCQAGFCSPRVMEILNRELGIPMEEITKSGGRSNIVLERTKGKNGGEA
jgi:aerobic-type carbon monoxide dehydrogenase small subunit (CoxS/CutS family)/bacterioferritin-associated ferredoxin